MLCWFILLFVIQNTINQKFMKHSVENSIFLLLWGFKMQIEMSLYEPCL